MKLAFDIIVGIAALYLLKEGKRRTNFVWIFIAITLMFAPLFTATLVQSVLVTGVFATAAYFAAN